MNAPDSNAGARGLANLLVLQERVRDAKDLAELAAVVVNDSRILCPYDICVFWSGSKGKGRVISVSGLPEPVKQAPFTLFVERICKALSKGEGSEARDVAPADVGGFDPVEWESYLPAQIVWHPVCAPDGSTFGGILVARPASWRDQERRILDRFCLSVGHAIQAQQGRRRSFRPLFGRKRLLAGVVVALLAAASFIEVPLFVLAPAEIVPLEPDVIRAPLRGVIDEVLVKPNQPVREGDTLLRMEDTPLRVELEVARQEYQVAQAEYRATQQTAAIDREASSRLQVLLARMRQKQAEMTFVERQLKRVVIRAPRSGLAITRRRDDLDGLPVSQGEKLMVLADPERIEIEAWLPVGDRIDSLQQGRLTLFLNALPDHAFEAEIREVAFRATPSPEGQMAFRVRATLQIDVEPPEIGLRGTARVYGDRERLYVFLFRKPWAVIRPWLQI